MAIVIKKGGKLVETRKFEKADFVTYQVRVWAWICEAFGVDAARNKRQRALRFFEEAVELAQACDMTEDEMIAEVKSVCRQPAHPPKREVGGVMTTLAGLSQANGWDFIDIAEEILSDNFVRIEQIRIKQKGKSV
jgi:hypothetical protein